ncbi:MAG: expansin EXLX1 family cellulose-binding protein [Verrucomicrobiota bacterium]
MKTPCLNPGLNTLLVVLCGLAGSLHGQLDTTSTFGGQATVYDIGTGPGNCSIPVADAGNLYAAMNGVQYGNADWCGAWVEVTGAGGTATLIIIDQCPECGHGDLDLSSEAWNQIVGGIPRIEPITWKWVSAPGSPGPIRFFANGASNQFFLQLQPRNVVNPVLKLEIFYSGSYVELTKDAEYRFTFEPGALIPEPITVRATDVFGNEVETENLFISSMQAGNGQSGSENFPPVGQDDIVVERSDGTEIADGESQEFGFSVDGGTSSLAFTIRNLGSDPLTGIAITKDGPDASDFTITSSPSTTLPVGGATTFTIAFSATTTGTKSAAIHIASSSTIPALASYDIDLTGESVSSSNDGDNDGLNDGAEALLADLGFDWEVSQPELVDTYYNNANIAGLFTTSQVQALHLDVPLLERNPGNGRFTLTLGLEKSADLISFTPFPFTAPEVTINGSGKIEFEFPAPDEAAFFRVEAN